MYSRQWGLLHDCRELYWLPVRNILGDKVFNSLHYTFLMIQMVKFVFINKTTSQAKMMELCNKNAPTFLVHTYYVLSLLINITCIKWSTPITLLLFQSRHAVATSTILSTFLHSFSDQRWWLSLTSRPNKVEFIVWRWGQRQPLKHCCFILEYWMLDLL